MPKRSDWFVYLLECGDGSLYTGIAKDPQKRLAQHEAGTGSRFARSRRPLRLVYQERHRTHSSALKREAAIKQWPRLKKLSLLQSST